MDSSFSTVRAWCSGFKKEVLRSFAVGWCCFIGLLQEFEQKGIGKQLHTIMLNWYFEQTINTVWLSTAFNTRAEQFYLKVGWQKVGLYGTKETQFEMTYEQWMKMKHK